MSKLSASNISISFGGLQALQSVDFEVDQGEIRGIIGPNGAGKTTLLNVICGINTPDEGEILLGDKSLVGLKTSQIAAHGIGRTFQTTKLFKGMTVLENVMTGLHGSLRANPFTAAFNFRTMRVEEAEAAERAREALNFIHMLEFADHQAISLSFGQQRLVEIARSLVNQPELILLDEPAVGLSLIRVEEVDRLLRRMREERGVTIIMIEHVIRHLHEQGLTILLVEQNVGVAAALSEKAYILANGEIEFSTDGKTLVDNPEVLRSYLGG